MFNARGFNSLPMAVTLLFSLELLLIFNKLFYYKVHDKMFFLKNLFYSNNYYSIIFYFVYLIFITIILLNKKFYKILVINIKFKLSIYLVHQINTINHLVNIFSKKIKDAKKQDWILFILSQKTLAVVIITVFFIFIIKNKNN
ncbi:hypothetical protein ARAF_2612 [Arsenophonus endosymbiont of Aleurodicus floccissimus]|nr:hypothetical protein ARAF_2612 [Arsenophonus endosymbiont of Aleurodicus floccissimus]